MYIGTKLRKLIVGDLDKDNGAHEEFDNPIAQNGFEGLGFGENDHLKAPEKMDKKLDAGQDKVLNKEDQELQNDVLLEENEEDGKIIEIYSKIYSVYCCYILIIQ